MHGLRFTIFRFSAHKFKIIMNHQRCIFHFYHKHCVVIINDRMRFLISKRRLSLQTTELSFPIIKVILNTVSYFGFISIYSTHEYFNTKRLVYRLQAVGSARYAFSVAYEAWAAFMPRRLQNNPLTLNNGFFVVELTWLSGVLYDNSISK